MKMPRYSLISRRICPRFQYSGVCHDVWSAKAFATKNSEMHRNNKVMSLSFLCICCGGIIQNVIQSYKVLFHDARTERNRIIVKIGRMQMTDKIKKLVNKFYHLTNNSNVSRIK